MDRKNGNDIDLNMLFGKVAPKAIELEEQVLGLLLDQFTPANLVLDVNDKLSADDFYSPANAIVAEAIFKLHSMAQKPSLISVMEYLRETGRLDEIGGPYYLTKLNTNTMSVVNLERYCLIIKQKSILRRLIDFSGIIINKAYKETEDVFDVLAEAESTLKGINHQISEMGVTQISDVAMRVIERLENRVVDAREGRINERDTYTCMREWDAINGPLFPGLYVIAARPGMGKGVHMTELCCKMGEKYPIGVINGEMTNEQLITRIGCNLMSIDNFLWKKDPKFVTDDELELVKTAMNMAMNLNLHIYDEVEIHKVCNRIKLWVSKYKVRCVMVDFLTLLNVNEGVGRYFTDTQRVNYIMNMLRELCKEEGIPIFLYAQLNRELLKSGPKEPNLGHLKQSGNIEEYAFQVCFLHRPEYYDPLAPVDEFGESTKGLMYQIVAKHRDGETGRIKHKAVLSKSQLQHWESFDALPSVGRISTAEPYQHRQLPVEKDDVFDAIDLQPF